METKSRASSKQKNGDFDETKTADDVIWPDDYSEKNAYEIKQSQLVLNLACIS